MMGEYFLFLLFIELFAGLCFSKLRDMERVLRDIRDLLKEADGNG
jgi:hypothetical protein